jgi:hypothetical protein
MDALMPLASAPVEIAGRNRMFRAIIIQAIRNDPEWKGGEYTAPPLNGLIAAECALWMMTSSPLRSQKANPTPGEADVTALREHAKQVDANDMLYQFEASGDYNREPQHSRGAAEGDQFGRLRSEPAGAGASGARDREGAAQPLHPDPDQRGDPEPRNRLAGGGMEAIPGGAAAEHRATATRLALRALLIEAPGARLRYLRPRAALRR